MCGRLVPLAFGLSTRGGRIKTLGAAELYFRQFSSRALRLIDDALDRPLSLARATGRLD